MKISGDRKWFVITRFFDQSCFYLLFFILSKYKSQHSTFYQFFMTDAVADNFFPPNSILTNV